MSASDKGPSVPSQPRTLRGIAVSHADPKNLESDFKYDAMAGVPVQMKGGVYEDVANKAKVQESGVKYAKFDPSFKVK